MEIEEGFEISIYAAEPDIGEPIAFTFDGKGRIWVVENYNYMDRRNHKEGEETHSHPDDKATLTSSLTFDDEYVRSWAIQFLCEDRNPGVEALAKFATMAKEDPSPVVRLCLATNSIRATLGYSLWSRHARGRHRRQKHPPYALVRSGTHGSRISRKGPRSRHLRPDSSTLDSHYPSPRQRLGSTDRPQKRWRTQSNLGSKMCKRLPRDSDFPTSQPKLTSNPECRKAFEMKRSFKRTL